MNKQEIIEKLKEVGIESENCYPKTSFISGGDVYIGIYPREASEDFYFFNIYDKKIYRLPQPANLDDFEKEIFKGSIKHLIPMHMCQLIWEDKPYIELVDTPFKEMTLRQYACIHMKIPSSGLEWLDSLIKQSNDKARMAGS